jgi:hypothetical protein
MAFVMRLILRVKRRYNQRASLAVIGYNVPKRNKTTARLDDAAYHRMGESPMAMGNCRAYGSGMGTGNAGRAGYHPGEQWRVDSLCAEVGEAREGKAEKRETVLRRIRLASRVGLDAAGMASDGSAQRGLVDVGVSDRVQGMEGIVFAAVGRVVVEGAGNSLAWSGAAAVVLGAGSPVGREQSSGADRVGGAVVGAARS